MALSDLTIIRRSLTSRLFSTIVTVLTVAVAVALMLILLAMPQAGESAFRRGSGNMHMLVSRDPSELQSVLNGIFYAEPPGNAIEWTKYEDIVARFRMLDYAIPVQQGDSYEGFPTLATTDAFFTRFEPDAGEPWAFASGRPFERSFEVVIGAEAATLTGLDVGDAISLQHGAGLSGHDHDEFDFQVVGLLEPTGGPHDRALFTDLESSWILHAHDRRERDEGHVHGTSVDDLVDEDRLITGIYIRVATREGSMMSAAQQQVFNMLRADPTVTVADPVREVDRLFDIVSNIDDIFLAMGMVVLISGAIAVMLALYNSIQQRRRQIAVLRVLGCSRGRVFGLIVSESAILGIAGALAGIGCAYLGTQAVAAAMKVRLGIVVDATVPVEAILMVTVATIVLSSLAGLVPAIMGYRTEVVRNLRPLG